MSRAAMTKVSMPKTCILDIPYEILFEIFRTLSRGKLIQISGLCSKFRHVAGDTRLWKNVFIKYGTRIKFLYEMFAFEDLYSEPWPVKVIDLSYTEINPPVFPQTEQIIKVEKLNLTSIIASEVTTAAILAKYQCTELHLSGDILGIGPEAFSKQTALEVLSVQGLRRRSKGYYTLMGLKEIHPLLAPIFRYFKTLKTLELSHMIFENFDMSGFVKTLPTSLEKLFLKSFPEDPFFEFLAERIPNLKELRIYSYLKVKHQSLLNLQFLEVLQFHYSSFLDRITHSYRDNISDLYKFLTKFSALKTVFITVDNPAHDKFPATFPGKLRAMLQSHGIIVGITVLEEWPSYPKDGNLWKVSKQVSKSM